MLLNCWTPKLCHARLVSASGYNQVLHQSLCTTSNVNNILNFKFRFSLFKKINLWFYFIIFETGSAPKTPVALHHFQCQQHSHVCCFRFFITSKIVEHWSVMSCPVLLKILTTRDLEENAHMITIFKGLLKECNPISTIHNNKIVDQISIHLRATKFLFEIATN